MVNDLAVNVERKWWRILFSQFRSSLILVLLVAMVVTVVIGDLRDGLIIGIAILVNSGLGFFQEYRAEQSLNSLRKLISQRAILKIGNEWVEVDAKTLKHGDLVRLTIGQKVPADGVLIEEDAINLNEAILTGESVSVTKKVSDECFMGTIVERGIGIMKIAKIGKETKIGEISGVMNAMTDEPSPMQKKINKLSTRLSIMVILVVVVIFVAGIWGGRSWIELLPLSIALAVAAIPEGLAVSLTVILSVGMKRILAKKAVVKTLTAAETLGGVTTICLDKTGTITLGKMTATGLKVTKKSDEKLIYEAALLCNDYRDPLEYAMADLAMERLSETKEKVEEKYKRVDEIAFDPKYKYILTRHNNGSDKYLDVLSGAPEVILNLSDKTNSKDEWTKDFSKIGEAGNRMVAFSVREVAKDIKNKNLSRDDLGGFRFLGVVLFDDPVRMGVEESLEMAKRAGIDLKVITGDYKETSWVAMQRAGLVNKDEKLDESRVLTGKDLDGLSKEELLKKVKGVVLFARTNPTQKLLIVSTLQELGEVVGMMGDGVNDAPALKKADIGITVNEASDVAREAADLILLDDDFGTVVSAIEEGRVIIGNIKKVTLFLLSGSFSMVVLMVGILVMGWPLPLVPIQILWINLIAEVLPTLGLTLEPRIKGEIFQSRVGTGKDLISFPTALFMILISFLVGLMGLWIFGYQMWYLNSSLIHARTVLFGWLSLVPLTYIYSIRNLRTGIWTGNLFDNPFLLFSCTLSWSLFLVVIYISGVAKIFRVSHMEGIDWWMLIGGIVMMFTLTEILKIPFRLSRRVVI